MAKFNLSNQGVNKTVTYEGAPAFKIADAKEKLVMQVLTTFVGEPKFYGNVDDQTMELVTDIRNMCRQDPKFVAALANFARNVYHLRSVSHVIVAEMAAIKESKPFVRRTMQNIAIRPDDMTETLAYYLNTHGKPIPNSLKKGLGDVFPKFDEYQLQKYNRDQVVKLRDVLCISHPRPLSAEYSDMWKRLLEGNLNIPYTWETELSARGNNKATWIDLIDSGKVGYMALLRNLRNILKAEPDNINKVFEQLSNRGRVLKSRQLPFRFFAAHRELQGLPSFYTEQALDALEVAMSISVENMERYPGKTLIVADGSGSMTWNHVSRRSTVSCADIAALLMATAQHSCDAVLTGTFSNRFDLVSLSRNDGILTNTNKVVRLMEGGATNMFLIFKWLLQKDMAVDRIIIISDDQAHPDWTGNYRARSDGSAAQYFREYQNKYPDVWLHMIDTTGYGTQQFMGKNVNYIPGWSERILSFIPFVEMGLTNIVNTIEEFGR